MQRHRSPHWIEVSEHQPPKGVAARSFPSTAVRIPETSKRQAQHMKPAAHEKNRRQFPGGGFLQVGLTLESYFVPYTATSQ